MKFLNETFLKIDSSNTSLWGRGWAWCRWIPYTSHSFGDTLFRLGCWNIGMSSGVSFFWAAPPRFQPAGISSSEMSEEWQVFWGGGYKWVWSTWLMRTIAGRCFICMSVCFHAHVDLMLREIPHNLPCQNFRIGRLRNFPTPKLDHAGCSGVFCSVIGWLCGPHTFVPLHSLLLSCFFFSFCCSFFPLHFSSKFFLFFFLLFFFF